MPLAHLCLVFLVALFFFPQNDANRITEARVPTQDARGPVATNGGYICFFDHENGFQICFQEGTAPRFQPGEPGFGTQGYQGYVTVISNLLTPVAYVYGHSLGGKANIYLTFVFGNLLHSYSFDYCPEIWKSPITARFSVYHVVNGLLSGSGEPVFVDLINKIPFTQENPSPGEPGGAQVACSTLRFPVQVIVPPPPVPQPQPQPDPTGSRPAPDGHLRDVRSEQSLELRGPMIFADSVYNGLCFTEDYFPQQAWFFSGGATGEEYVGQNGQYHQFYKGAVYDYNTGKTAFAYGHSPRGSRHVILSANIEGRGLVTYHLEFALDDSSRIQAGYSYVGSTGQMKVNVVFQRAMFYDCFA